MKTNKSYLLITAVLTFLFTLPSTHMLAQENIIDRLDKSLGVKLPAEYEAKVRDLLKNSNVFKVKGADDCTAQFIENQMKVDWKIDKQNQLVFLWHCIYKQITGEDLYNPEDGDSNRLQNFNDRVVGIRIRAEGQRYKNEIVAYMNNVSAEAQQRSAKAKQQSVDEGLEALTEIINGFEKYITFFQNMINLDGATQTLANFNQEKNTLLERTEKFRSEQQSNQHPSATEAENLKKTEDQLLLDITKQRTDVVKQINTVIEKNIPEIDKLINSTAQNNEEAQQQLDKAKQRYAEAQRAISDSKLATAEDRLRSTMALLRSAEADRQIAEAQQRSAESRQEALNILSEELDVIISSYNNYKSNDKMLEKLKSLKPEIETATSLYKQLDIDIKDVLREKIGDETKYKEFLKIFEIE